MERMESKVRIKYFTHIWKYIRKHNPWTPGFLKIIFAMKTWQLTTHSFCDGMSGRVKFRFSLLQSSIQVHVKKSQTKILCCVFASESSSPSPSPSPSSSSSSDTQPGSQRRTFWILALFNNSLRKRPTEFKVIIFETHRSIAIVGGEDLFDNHRLLRKQPEPGGETWEKTESWEREGTTQEAKKQVREGWWRW